MTNPVISAPARYVAPTAVAFSTAGTATIVDASNPLPVGERAYQGASTITPGTIQAPARAIAVQCAVAGTVTLRLADDSQIGLSVETGLTILPFAVKTVVTAETSAVASYANLV